MLVVTIMATMMAPFKPCMVFSPLVKTAIAVFACTGARCADQERTLGQRPFSGRLVPKCHAKSDVPSALASLEKEAKSSSVN
jgi:hypothetical protein